jgi:predicted Fe-Mo cluster-binding NifX family protein
VATSTSEQSTVAICTDGENVAAHFGRCPTYTIVAIADGSIQRREQIPNPGHEPGFLPGYLAEHGVTCVVAGGMGPRAQMLFGQHGIRTIVGISCSVEDALQTLLRGELESGESTCDH